jgi:uncharacterized protein YxjI
MAVSVTCECSNTFSLKDEFAGRLVKCPSCDTTIRAGTTEFTATSQADPVFGRDVFLLRQQALRINERYDISDEQGQPLLFVERPAYLLRNIGGLLVGFVASFAWACVLILAAQAIGVGLLADLLAILAIVGFIPILVIVGTRLGKKRHVSFYTREDRSERVLEVLQDSKLHFVVATYTVQDADGTVLARFRKNYLYNLVRRKWDILRPDGTVEWVAREDSIILSLVRRFVPFMGLIRTNFIFQPAGKEQVIGEFRRKFTILDRYVLDLTADRARAFDRRVAVALGVMLDTGERR